MIGRILLTISSIIQLLGPFIADYNKTHVLNPAWPPHARFHNGQTMSMGVCLSVLTVYYTFRPLPKRLRQAQRAAARQSSAPTGPQQGRAKGPQVRIQLSASNNADTSPTPTTTTDTDTDTEPSQEQDQTPYDPLAAAVDAKKDDIFTAALFASLFWFTGLSAILYPGSRGQDPEFGGAWFPQLPLFAGLLALGWVGWGVERWEIARGGRRS